MARERQPTVAGAHASVHVHGAAQLRKRLRRELRRLDAAGLSLYVDGRRDTVRLAVRANHQRQLVPADEALARLSELPDGAGVQATLDGLART